MWKKYDENQVELVVILMMSPARFACPPSPTAVFVYLEKPQIAKRSEFGTQKIRHFIGNTVVFARVIQPRCDR